LLPKEVNAPEKSEVGRGRCGCGNLLCPVPTKVVIPKKLDGSLFTYLPNLPNRPQCRPVSSGPDRTCRVDLPLKVSSGPLAVWAGQNMSCTYTYGPLGKVVGGGYTVVRHKSPGENSFPSGCPTVVFSFRPRVPRRQQCSLSGTLCGWECSSLPPSPVRRNLGEGQGEG